MKTLPSLIEAKIDRQPDGCWVWTAARSSRGYGKVRTKWSQSRYAHRAVYELLVGPIEDETIDHLCQNRACVNPDHLEPVSRIVNTWRGRAMSDDGETCQRGHSDWTISSGDGRRRCRRCRADRKKRYRARNRSITKEHE